MSTISASTTSTTAYKVTADTTGTLVLQTGATPTTAVTVNSVQGVQILNTLGVGNATPSTSGSGVSFPATQSASSDANTLDDYEEGTWTATVSWATQGTGSGNVTGYYTKIGRTVIVSCYPIPAKGTASGAFKITGLPFTPVENTACAIRTDGIGAASKVLQSATVGTEIRFILANQSTTYGTDPTAADMNATCYINVQCTFQI